MTNESKETREMTEPQVIDIDDVQEDETAEPEPSSDVAVPEEISEVEIATGNIPITPEVTELTRMAQLAATFAHARLVPEALREKPADVLLVMMTARSLGIDFPTGFRELYIIDGKVSMSTKMKLALVRQRGHKVWPDDDNNDIEATWYGERGGIRYKSTFTIEDARRVSAKEHGKTITLDQKSSWRQFPKRMLSWRALGYLLDDMTSDVATGIYSPDELGAVEDGDGNVIDIGEVEPIVQSEQQARKSDRAQAKQELAPEDERRALKALIDSLPPSVKRGDAGLVGRWREADFPPVMELPAGSMRRAKAMVRGFETQAKKDGWEPSAQISQTDSQVSEDPKPGETQENAIPPSEPVDAEQAGGGRYPADPDAQRAAIAHELQDALSDVPDDVTQAATEFAKNVPWQKVDRALRERGEEIDGLHVDSRRMLLVAYLVAEYPEHGVPGFDEDIVTEEA